MQELLHFTSWLVKETKRVPTGNRITARHNLNNTLSHYNTGLQNWLIHILDFDNDHHNNKNLKLVKCRQYSSNNNKKYSWKLF